MNVLSEKTKKITEAFEYCMKNEPLAFRNTFGINRQQFKGIQREQKKLEEAMKKLTPTQFKLIEIFIKQEKIKLEKEFKQRTISLHSCVNAALTQLVDLTCDDIDKFWKDVNEMIPEDIQSRQEMIKMNEKECLEMDKQVREFIIEKLEEGKGIGEIKEDLKFKFSKLSSAQRTNAVKEVKEEWIEEKGAEKIAKIISGEDEELQHNKMDESLKNVGLISSENIMKGTIATAEIKEEPVIKANKLPKISEQLNVNLINFKKDKESLYKIILDYENLISVKREELESIKEKERAVEKAKELLSSVGI